MDTAIASGTNTNMDGHGSDEVQFWLMNPVTVCLTCVDFSDRLNEHFGVWKTKEAVYNSMFSFHLSSDRAKLKGSS